MLELDIRIRRLWDRVSLEPQRWRAAQYPQKAEVWVVGVLGDRCLYFNEVEGGWGWGRFSEWGRVADFHWEQLEIQHVVAQTLFAIDNGDRG